MKKLCYGMVGGGPGSLIGDAHRRAINLDGLAEYPQGWLAYEGQWGGKQGQWRCDPA